MMLLKSSIFVIRFLLTMTLSLSSGSVMAGGIVVMACAQCDNADGLNACLVGSWQLDKDDLRKILATSSRPL